MADILDTLKTMLGDDAEDKIKAVLSALDTGSTKEKNEEHENEDAKDMPESVPASATPTPALNFSPDSIGQIMKLKSIAEDLSHPNDSRSQLLMSLRPYMRSSRQKSIDDAVKLLNLTKFSQLFR